MHVNLVQYGASVAKLYFYYSTMNAGKSTTLLQSAYNYRERGMDVLLFTPDFDDRFEDNHITSRIGLKSTAVGFNRDLDLFKYSEVACAANPKITCVLLDEAQFLTKSQVFQLSEIVDNLKLPVLAYGLRTDFQGNPFPGSQYLLAWADELIEIKTICHCGRKASMVLRLDNDGHVVEEGAQVKIGGNNHYVSVCRLHFKAKDPRQTQTQEAEIAEIA